MKFLLLVIDLICIHICLDIISLPLKYLNFLRLLFLTQAWAFIQQFRHMLEVQYIFEQRNFGKGFLSERCIYIDFAHSLFFIGALDMPKMFQGSENGLSATPIFILEKLKDSD